MRIRTGTSGYSYKEWKGHFYPEQLAAKDMLRYYAERFRAVEINNTFYRMPSESVLKAWAAEVPGDFAFALKASRRITHDKRLQDVGDSVSYLVKTAGTLGDRLGPLLFQLPPFLKKDLPRLRELLALLPPETRSAVEFRHASWFDDEVYAALREGHAALCVADTGEEGDAPFIATADWGYLRLRRVAYGDSDLKDWSDRVRGQPWSEAFVFFKHEDEATGPKLAARFAELCAA
jgi:uncharacterized protein YecE (DUF72 family)